ncbi:hypothetical protein GCM10027605_43770 [Micromonospora zhanjiangensis]
MDIMYMASIGSRRPVLPYDPPMDGVTPADRNPLRTTTHRIGGRAYQGVAGRTGEVFDPATGRVAGRVDLADATVVDAAVAAAAEAFPRWRDTSLARRSAVLFAFREALFARQDELAALVTAEHGKVLSDAVGEVRRGLESVEFACGVPYLLRGGSPRTPRPGWTSTRSGSRSAWSG